ncbi:hypothetical protein CEXT_645271 [Caerostris extrusa]|uniref:Uncharacterized protein n=1 Tax=Caerostris extrusa TaxID=172846 RepID=A0AAV4WNY9_CAEEX|nr:hypothetical protein CEXT_645271 [Caerostris extrusa]
MQQRVASNRSNIRCCSIFIKQPFIQPTPQTRINYQLSHTGVTDYFAVDPFPPGSSNTSSSLTKSPNPNLTYRIFPASQHAGERVRIKPQQYTSLLHIHQAAIHPGHPSNANQLPALTYREEENAPTVIVKIPLPIFVFNESEIQKVPRDADTAGSSNTSSSLTKSPDPNLTYRIFQLPNMQQRVASNRSNIRCCSIFIKQPFIQPTPSNANQLPALTYRCHRLFRS